MVEGARTLTVAVESVGEPNVDEDGPWLPSRSWASAAGQAGGMAASAADIARWGYLPQDWFQSDLLGKLI